MFSAGLWLVARIVRAGDKDQADGPVGGGRPAAAVKPAPGDQP